MQDTLQELLSDTFLEKINIPNIKARFRLFQAQIKSLADNTKDSPDFREEAIENSTNLLEEAFDSVIPHANKTYDNDSGERMRCMDANNR